MATVAMFMSAASGAVACALFGYMCATEFSTPGIVFVLLSLVEALVCFFSALELAN